MSLTTSLETADGLRNARSSRGARLPLSLAQYSRHYAPRDAPMPGSMDELLSITGQDLAVGEGLAD